MAFGYHTLLPSASCLSISLQRLENTYTVCFHFRYSYNSGLCNSSLRGLETAHILGISLTDSSKISEVWFTKSQKITGLYVIHKAWIRTALV
uniref:Uncharacterized protein n=1 Tax=Pyxicephalus adspersus TaxID=30357 RepID=A0AAV2ZUH5_PYXAD|nr:TPA: hypothetical protein GDO54_013187 [Pyxicephalus adspersus]